MDRYRALKKEIQNIPNLPGVYKFYDASGNLIYIGKSVNLRKRIYSYFTGVKKGKTERLVLSIDRYSYEVHDTHLEARLRECVLIKTLKPHFNAQYKNDSRYLYLELCDDKNIQLIRHSSIKKQDSIGPFRSRRILEETLSGLSNLYPITNGDGINFEYHIFPRKMNPEERFETQNNIVKILNDRNFSNDFLNKLSEEMKREAVQLKFERADFYKKLHDNLIYILKSIDIKDKFENKSHILKIKSGVMYKCFYISGGYIKNVYYMDKKGNKVSEDKKYSIIEGFTTSELKDEKSLLDIREIIYSEAISKPENIIWME